MTTTHTNRRRGALAGAVAAVVATGLLAAGAAGAPGRAPAEDAIAFARDGELYVGSPGRSARRLTSNRVFDGMPAWSPDRTRIAFVRSTGRDADVYVMRADGTGVRRLTGGARPGRGAQDLYPAWSPDGRWLAFSSTRGDREPELYVMRADGSRVRRLTRTPRYVQNIQPRYSPDGRSIVFASNRLAYWNFELYRVRAADGRRLERLTFWGSGEDGAPGDDLMPSYSPDGKRIAFVSDRGGGYGVWTMRADGSDLRRAARHPRLNVAFPRYSGDGRSLVYTTFPPDGAGGDERLWTVGANGGRPTPRGAGTEPDW